MRSFLAAACAVALAACGGLEESMDLAESTQAPIVGGTADPLDPAVVVLVAAGKPYCTGSLIDSRHVLTAAHCVQGSVVSAFDKAGFGPDVDHLTKSVGIGAQVQHPYYRGEGNPYDVAVLELEEEVTGVQPLPILDVPLRQADVGRSVRHIGFGATAENPTRGAGEKREVTYAITQVDANFVYSGAEGQQTCYGDSGGPALVKGEDGIERIAGVVSDGPDCHNVGWDQRVDTDEIRAWIALQVTTPTAPGGGGIDCSNFALGSLSPLALVWLGRRRRSDSAE